MSGTGKKVGVIGSGLVGRSWAMIFASAGYSVSLYDLDSQQVERALEDIGSQLLSLEKEGVPRGTGTASEQRKLVSASTSFEETVKGAVYIQECVPEVLSIKKETFNKIGEFMSPGAIAGSSTSYIQPSEFMEDMPNRGRALVAHPVNPPYYAPLVELVPSKWTDASALTACRSLLEAVGQAPVTLSKEKYGFSLNRIQAAVMMECWKQVSEGLLSVKDVDTVMWAGLGMRYAFIGPLETAHLNAEGMRVYLRKFAESQLNTARDFAPIPESEYKEGTPTADDICSQLEALVPLDKLAERRAWRDGHVAGLAQLKRRMAQKKE